MASRSSSLRSNSPRNYGAIGEEKRLLIQSEIPGDDISILPADNNGGHDSKTDEEVDMGSISVKSQVRDCCRSTCTTKNALSKFPLVTWLPKYRLDSLQSDIIAGLTVGLTVIPQGLAYATIAGLPPQYGLYSAFMGCFVYTLMGTSKDITLGPTAIMSLMTATFATMDGQDATLAVALTLICGVIQLAMGILKLGIFVDFISYPVINAFTSAAAITIGIGQLKHIFGLKDVSREFIHTVYDICRKLPETKVYDLIFGVSSLIIVTLLKKLRTVKWAGEDDPEVTVSVPVKVFRKFVWLCGTGANAVIVICAAGTTAIIESQDPNITEHITVTGDIKAGLPTFEPPSFEYVNHETNVTWGAGDIFGQIGAGVGIVPLLGLVETMAIGKAFARANDYKIDPTQELLAIGVANILSSFVQAYPITGSFSRTAVNSQSGVRTPMGGVFTGGLVILALCVLTPWFYYIPKAALAAVIISAVIQMVDYKIVATLWRANKLDLIPLFVTFIGSLTVGIEYGILMGIGIHILILMYPIARPKIKYTVQRGFVIVTPLQGLSFPGAEHVESKAMLKAMEGEKPRNILINMEHLADLDYTAIQSLKTLANTAKKSDVKLILCNGQPRVNTLIRNAQVQELYVKKNMKDVFDEFSSIQDEESGIIEEREPFMSNI